MAQRIKGQEVICQIVADGQLEDEITAIVDFNDSTDLEIIAKGYLGEKTNRQDDILNGYSGSLTFHLQTQNWYTLKAKIEARAKREQPDLQFNFAKTLFFPNGDTPTVTFADVKFGKIDEKAGSRADYLSVTIPWATDAIMVQQS
jgi:hypothetical protein